jgi:hypothetical protein
MACSEEVNKLTQSHEGFRRESLGLHVLLPGDSGEPLAKVGSPPRAWGTRNRRHLLTPVPSLLARGCYALPPKRHLGRMQATVPATQTSLPKSDYFEYPIVNAAPA